MGRPSRNKSEARRVGEVIRSRRKALNVSITDLACRAGIDVSQMSKIDRGEGGTNLRGYADIAQALGWTPGEFLDAVFVVGRNGRRSPKHSE